MKPDNAHDWATCPLCNGNGWFETKPHAVPCGQCDGQGLINPKTLDAYRFPEVNHADQSVSVSVRPAG